MVARIAPRLVCPPSLPRSTLNGGNQLSGTLPSSLGSWTSLLQLCVFRSGRSYLSALSLSSLHRELGPNQLSGTIPSSMGSLTSLNQLCVRHCGHPLASLSVPTRQRSFLFGSGLCGPVPMPHQPDDGPLPPCRFMCTVQDAACSGLADLYYSTGGQDTWLRRDGWEQAAQMSTPVDYCSFYGLACTSGSPAVLTSLDLASNSLIGTLPPVFGSLTSLEQLTFHNNALSGTLPSTVGSLTAVRLLDLGENKLFGTLPATLASLTSLTNLFLSGSGLCGFVPSAHQPDDGGILPCIFLCSKQDQTCNALGGLFYATNGAGWKNSSGWEQAYLTIQTDYCSFYGCRCNSSGVLTALELVSNQLSGTIPPQLGSLTTLTSLWLIGNPQLGGTIPEKLSSMRSLQSLDFYNNRLNGALPAWLSSLTSLTRLNLEANELSGTIPPILGPLASLVWLNFQYNELSGTIPTSLGSLTSLTLLYVPAPAASFAAHLSAQISLWQPPERHHPYLTGRPDASDSVVRAHVPA